MRAAYGIILSLFPAKHRAAFASEMKRTFEQAAANHCGRGPMARVCFGGRELTGLVSGLCAEWVARYRAGNCYLAEESSEVVEMPEKIADLENLLRRLIKLMESSIANHDFRKARFYSAAEHATRRKLQQLLND